MKKKKQILNFNQLGIIGLTLALVILTIIFLVSMDQDKYTFEEGFNELAKLDLRYNTDFKTEEIGGNLVEFENIDPYLEDLRLFREEVTKTIDLANVTNEESALVQFIDFRTLALLSQKNYFLGTFVGNKGLADSEDGFSCLDAGHLINAGYYFNTSYSAGLEAYLQLDRLLGHHQHTPGVWELVGVNSEKPRWFFSNLGGLKNLVRRNELALVEFCFVDLSQGFIGLVDPADYTLRTDNALIQENIQEKGLNISYTTV